MPQPWARWAIVVFWVMMTVWLFNRDVMPRLGFGDFDYRTVLTTRAVAEPTHWLVEMDGDHIGSVTNVISPKPDGSYGMKSRTSLSTSIFGDEQAETQLLIESTFNVSSLGRLRSVEIDLEVEGTQLRVSIYGQVKGNEIVFRTTGLPTFSDEVSMPIDPESLMFDPFGQVHSWPNLRIGKTWVTRTVNPMSALMGTGTLLGGSGPSIDVVTNEVVKVDDLHWGDHLIRCFLIEHRHGPMAAQSWARTSDGKVFQHKLAIAGGLTLRLDPVMHELE
ncbi:hypothetical protein Pan216_53170 [Planctomycetes bacterium Pan216]|uniref:Uncharacterized protein n=1 Tax=Kolteria novifilia TaxID=2527975 RepID=A0A518BBV0_9BACT|nr:hypothetical protein Pan216_53170 [Planctomycetes bacterium Pan216]